MLNPLHLRHIPHPNPESLVDRRENQFYAVKVLGGQRLDGLSVTQLHAERLAELGSRSFVVGKHTTYGEVVPELVMLRSSLPPEAVLFINAFEGIFRWPVVGSRMDLIGVVGVTRSHDKGARNMTKEERLIYLNQLAVERAVRLMEAEHPDGHGNQVVDYSFGEGIRIPHGVGRKLKEGAYRAAMIVAAREKRSVPLMICGQAHTQLGNNFIRDPAGGFAVSYAEPYEVTRGHIKMSDEWHAKQCEHLAGVMLAATNECCSVLDMPPMELVDVRKLTTLERVRIQLGLAVDC